VVLNKIDILADPLSSPAQLAAQMDTQVQHIAKALDIAPQRVYPLSARDALAARIHGDAEALRRSGLPPLESALVERMLPRQRAVLAQAASALAQALRDAATHQLGQRRRHNAEQLLELRGLRGKSAVKQRALRLRLEAEATDFERCSARLAAMRAVQTRLLHRALHALSAELLRDHMAELQRALAGGALKLGARKAFQVLCRQLRESVGTARLQVDEMQQMLSASHRQLNAEYGFSFSLGMAPALEAAHAELELIESSYSQYLGPAQVWRLSNAAFMQQFQRMLLSKLRMVFETAAGEVELWSKAATTQIDQQLRERREAFARRREALQRVQGASDELEQRLQELDQHDKRLAGLQWRVESMSDQLRSAAQQALKVDDGDDSNAWRATAS
jgi:hypothetical protein